MALKFHYLCLAIISAFASSIALGDDIHQAVLQNGIYTFDDNDTDTGTEADGIALIRHYLLVNVLIRMGSARCPLGLIVRRFRRRGLLRAT